MISKSIRLNNISLPLIVGEFSMIPFNINTLNGLTGEFKKIVNSMIGSLPKLNGTAFLTVHGKVLKKGGTLRRGSPHTDGNFEPVNMSFGGGGGFKVGESGPDYNSPLHKRQYNSLKGGIIMVSNFESCLGWNGDFNGLPGVGGDCRHINLSGEFMLKKDAVYYGNNHFIHESLPVDQDVHRVMARITLPEHHEFIN